MDLEKEYKRLVAKIKTAHQFAQTDSTKSVLEDILPELCESEDERIRKELIEFLRESYSRGYATEECAKWLVWLDRPKAEKQDYSELSNLERAILRGFLSAGVENVPVAIIKETANECERTQTIANENANAEWSEEDERIVRFYEDDYDNNLGDMPMCDVIENRIKFKDWLINRLKTIRPQSQLKPSEVVGGLFWHSPFPTICLDDCRDYNFKDNQKVRVIIVKEEKNGTE